MKGIERDVIVIGAGPAGSICAAYLAKAGVDVLLIDKEVFPRDKTCGDMITAGMAKHITTLEAADKLDRMSVFVNHLLLVSDCGNEALIPFECYGTKRRELDALLTETAMSWGAEFRQGCRATGLIRERGRVCGVKILEGGVESELRCRMVVGADGAFSFTAKEAGMMKEEPWAMSIGISAYFEGVHLDRSIAIGQYSAYGAVFFDRALAPGYAWVLPSGDGGVLHGHCNVGLVIDYTDGIREGAPTPEERFASWIGRSSRAATMLSGAKQITPWRRGKQTYITQNTPRTADGLILIGDAASVMLPLKGDGLSAAADSARAAADTVWEALKQEDFSGLFLHRTLAGHSSQPDPAAVKDQLKRRRLIRESLMDPAGTDRAVQRLRGNEALAKKLLED